jgi:hypothetical protein
MTSDQHSELQLQLIQRSDQTAKALQQSNLVAHESIASLRDSNRNSENVIKNLTSRCDQLEKKLESYTSGEHRNNPTQFRKSIQVLEDVDANGVYGDCGEGFSRNVIDCLQMGRACNGTQLKYIASKREEEYLEQEKKRIAKKTETSRKYQETRAAKKAKIS